eukprot:6769884-Pyramimonas_sp.AAC.1
MQEHIAQHTTQQRNLTNEWYSSFFPDVVRFQFSLPRGGAGVFRPRALVRRNIAVRVSSRNKWKTAADLTTPAAAIHRSGAPECGMH